MASVSPISSVSYSTAGDTASNSGASRIPQKALGQQDFLKLLAVQFQKQDPMKPMEDQAFIAQMAQFSALEQASGMARDMTAMRTDQQRAVANSYLGHRVTVDAGQGNRVSGDVTAVDVSGAEPRIIVGGTPFSLTAVLRVEPGLVSAPSVTPENPGGA